MTKVFILCLEKPLNNIIYFLSKAVYLSLEEKIIMKKIIILFTLLLMCNNAFASNATIDKIEKSLYGFTFSNESDTSRLNRIEKKVYGQTQSGKQDTRIAKLSKDLNADQMGKEIEPREDTFMTDDDYIVYEKEPSSAATMDYPAIDELEKQVFKKEFKGQNIKTRLSNLEQKTFNKTYDKDDLATRVDRLKAQLKPQSFLANGMHQQENNFYTYPADKFPQDYHLDSYGDPYDFDYDSYNSRRTQQSYSNNNTFTKAAKPLNLSKIEKQIYHKKFDNEPTSTRLTRIETSIFGTSFPNDSDSERLERLSSAIQAQKSASHYDSDKWNRNMATAFQIGTLILMVLACIL